MPFSMAAFTIGGLSMIGVPLTVGFVSKWYIAIGALNAGMWYFVPVILVSSLLTTIYFWRIIESIYFPQKSEVRSQNKEHRTQNTDINTPKSRISGEAPPGMVVPTCVLAGLCIFFGVAAFIPVSIAQKTAAMLLGGM